MYKHKHYIVLWVHIQKKHMSGGSFHIFDELLTGRGEYFVSFRRIKPTEALGSVTRLKHEIIYYTEHVFLIAAGLVPQTSVLV